MNFSFLPFAVGFCGLFMLIKLRFFLFRHPKKCLLNLLSRFRRTDSRKALCLALAGTLGVGNIFGVAAGILIGGAGSLFWLALSSVFSMIIKYSEATLCVSLKKEGRGGMQYVLEELYPKNGKLLGGIYASFCLALALFMGSSMQSAAVSDTFFYSFGFFHAGCAIILSLLLVITVIRGISGIERLTSFLIPLSAMVYSLMSLSVIILKMDNIPLVFKEIFSEAFGIRQAFGGAVSFLFSKAMKEGFARGILSNEAGIGTSSMALSRMEATAPASVGLFGIFEVFLDTFILCPLTGLVILLSVPDISVYKTPMSLICAAFASTLGSFSLYFLAVCISLFAFSTLICWYYYGNECCIYLFKKDRPFLYTFAFLFSIFIGALSDSVGIIAVTDGIIFLMALITLFTILKFSGKIAELTKEFLN